MPEEIKILKNCQQGKHLLQTIMTVNLPFAEEQVVRWCKDCGSVTVDIDCDNRIFPGAVMKMKSPNIAKEYR